MQVFLDQPNHRARSQPGRSTASRPGPPRPPRSALRPWPSEAVARAWQPLRSALGPRAAPAAGTPSLARRDSLCLPSPGVQRPVRAAPRRTEERGREIPSWTSEAVEVNKKSLRLEREIKAIKTNVKIMPTLWRKMIQAAKCKIPSR
ncbi:Bile Acyl-Coa Synthetase [Manis pentadactyla]|nr:Bile Acyl-Coa Synthetase [Manis pentadactyla]